MSTTPSPNSVSGAVLGYAKPHRFRTQPSGTLGRIGSLLGSLVVWYIIGGFTIGAFVGFIRIPYIGWAMVPAVLLGILAIPAIRQAQKLVRRNQAEAVIDALAEATQLGMPLPDMLAALAKSEGGKFRRHIDDCRQLLLQGSPLAPALEAAFPGISRQAVAELAAAEPAGQLQPALQRLAQEPRRRAAADPHRQPALVVVYILLYVCVFALSFTLFLIVVMPKYSGIFRDFKMPVPRTWLLDLSWSLAEFEITQWLWLVPVTVLQIYLGRLVWSFLPVNILQGASLPWLTDYLVNWLPLAGRMRRDRALSSALALIADCTRAGVTLEKAVAQAGLLEIHLPTTRRLRKWAGRLHAGETISNAARQSGLPATLVKMLATAEHSATVPQTLHFLAGHYHDRFSRTTILVQNAAIPAFTLLFAGLTLTVWRTALLPIFKLIDHAADMGYH